mmetsp:Transcript_25329/g.68827  ORF Transcript_25329/g.68827 Transcript_25329/m.68827 type:complete len:260 (+) Transcript_25329:765-1544(+)
MMEEARASTSTFWASGAASGKDSSLLTSALSSGPAAPSGSSCASSPNMAFTSASDTSDLESTADLKLARYLSTTSLSKLGSFSSSCLIAGPRFSVSCSADRRGTSWASTESMRAMSASCRVLSGRSSASSVEPISFRVSSDRSSLAKSSRYSRTSGSSKMSGFAAFSSEATSLSEIWAALERFFVARRASSSWVLSSSAPLASISQSHMASLPVLVGASWFSAASPKFSSLSASMTMRSSISLILSMDLACSRLSSPSS